MHSRPVSGSVTTGRTAYRHGLRSVSIELQKEYAELGLKLLERENPGPRSNVNGTVKFRKGQGPQGYPLFPDEMD